MIAATDVVRRRLDGAPSSATLDALELLERAVETRPWSRTALAEELASSDRVWIVAEVEGVPAAFAGSARLGDDVHVLRLTVEASRRRCGIGGALLDDLIAAARAERAASVTLEVRAGNVGAIALYRGRGFTARGRRPGYYADGEDALILTLDPDGVADRVRPGEDD